jgi:hypothetical protein
MFFFRVRRSLFHLGTLLAIAQEGVKLFNITPLPTVSNVRKRHAKAKVTAPQAYRHSARNRSPHGGLAVLRQDARLNSPARRKRRNGSRK